MFLTEFTTETIGMVIATLIFTLWKTTSQVVYKFYPFIPGSPVPYIGHVSEQIPLQVHNTLICALRHSMMLYSYCRNLKNTKNITDKKFTEVTQTWHSGTATAKQKMKCSS